MPPVLRLVLCADTHLGHGLVVPPGDVLVHAGDLTCSGSLAELALAADFLASLPHRHKLVVAGNHELCLEREPEAAWPLLARVTTLHDSGTTVAGVRFWGSPWQPIFFDWAFNLPRGAALAARWARMPAGIDVLVTHGPPRGIGDRVGDGRHEGCDDLLARVKVVAPLVHVFGHIHEDRGAWRMGDTLFVNATTAEGRLPATVVDVDPATGRAEVVPP
ncbi:MAG: metallophosphatase domain-containing protein [Polyangiaceae bacterium]|nr:metallophosphatase domain-containing protein [Polyangiaceae bacterium]